MRRHRLPLRALLSVVAGCWLAAGPGGGVLQAALACSPAMMHMAHQHAGPCLCTQMAGGFDQALSAAVPPVTPAGAIMVGQIFRTPHVSPFPFPVSPTFAPETPPPIAV